VLALQVLGERCVAKINIFTQSSHDGTVEVNNDCVMGSQIISGHEKLQNNSVAIKLQTKTLGNDVNWIAADCA
jgi:hypothetical protein